MTINISINGGLTAAPDIRYSQNGVAVASFTVASTERYKKDNDWVDGKKLYLRCSAFREIAENIAASQLDKGAQVTVTGKLHTREWEQDGQKRSGVELDVTDFAVSLKRATVQVTRKQIGAASSSHQHPQGTAQQAWDAAPAAAQSDVWGAPDTTYPQEVPF